MPTTSQFEMNDNDEIDTAARSPHSADTMQTMYEMSDSPCCSTCGEIMVRNGSCYLCMSCGTSSGCS